MKLYSYEVTESAREVVEDGSKLLKKWLDALPAKWRSSIRHHEPSGDR